MVDKVEIVATGGGGGNGVVSFRREKFVPFGGPDGGDGGGGGSVYIEADGRFTNLAQFKRKRRFMGGLGGSGGGRKKHGKGGGDVTVYVPVGTVISLKGEGVGVTMLADLKQGGQRVMVAKGGRGGLGNTHFTTSTKKAPKIATEGTLGEEVHLILDLKLIADVGIIGYPNVGKSTLLGAVSGAKPKTADYSFTTLEPIQGVVEVGLKTSIWAEIPGLIEGAHLGKGLGHEFLRHAERTKVLLHLLDGSSPTLMGDMDSLNSELALYKSVLAQKPQVMVVNKVDLPQVQARLAEVKQFFDSLGVTVMFISAATGQGISELVSVVTKIADMVCIEEADLDMPVTVFRPEPKARRG